MNVTDLEEKRRLIIQEIQHVEDEWILRAIGKLLDLEDSVDIEAYNQDIDFAMKQYKAGNYKTQEQLEDEWLKIEQDEKDYKNGVSKNYSWDEVKNLVLKKV